MIEIIPNWHPILVHFSIGLFFTAVLFYLARCLLPIAHPWRAQWLIMANWSLWAGCLFTVATVIAGFLAYNSVEHDRAAHAAMTLHRNWALSAAGLFLALGLAAIYLARRQRSPGAVFLVSAAIAVVILLTTAYLGAEVVYRHGIGVMSLPEIEADAQPSADEGHNHTHEH